jgi:CDP-diacylglycerol--glycerol-3-phosphate 3-phosphatidyltransferase
MPSVYDLKPRFQNLLRPVMGKIARAGITPNVVTLVAVAGSIAAGAAISQAASCPALLLVLPGWLLARMALNAIDGMMARELEMATPLGAVLNEVCDAISDLGLYLPLAFVDQRASFAVVAFSIGALLTEFCGVLGRALGATRRYDGPMGKSDRALIVGALGVVTFVFASVLPFWPLIFWAGAGLTAVTCWKRLAGALRESQQK